MTSKNKNSTLHDDIKLIPLVIFVTGWCTGGCSDLLFDAILGSRTSRITWNDSAVPSSGAYILLYILLVHAPKPAKEAQVLLGFVPSQ